MCGNQHLFTLFRISQYQFSPLFSPGLLFGEWPQFLEKFAHNRSPWATYWGNGLIIGEAKLFNMQYVSQVQLCFLKITRQPFLRQTACLPVEVLPAGWGTQALLPRSFQQQSFPAGPSGGGGVPRPSFPGPSSSSPSQLVLLGGGGYPGPPSQVLPAAVLPSWSFHWGGYPGPPSQVLPAAVLPSWSFHWGGTQALLPRSFQQQSFPAGPSMRGCHVTYPIMHLMLHVCPPRHQLMGVAWCSCLYTAGMPPPSWTDWQTNMSENITFPQTRYVGGNNSSKYIKLFHMYMFYLK